MMPPDKLITVMQVLLAQLEQTLATAPQVNEDNRADDLRNQLDRYRDKIYRIRKVMRRSQEADRRRKDLEKQNKKNSR